MARSAGWGSLPQRLVNHPQDAFQILIHIIVPEAQDRETLRDEALIACSVSLRMSIEVVLTTIDLDDEPVFQANKIDNESVARRLSPEMEATLRQERR